jgi:hypothetical protein
MDAVHYLLQRRSHVYTIHCAIQIDLASTVSMQYTLSTCIGVVSHLSARQQVDVSLYEIIQSWTWHEETFIPAWSCVSHSWRPTYYLTCIVLSICLYISACRRSEVTMEQSLRMFPRPCIVVFTVALHWTLSWALWIDWLKFLWNCKLFYWWCLAVDCSFSVTDSVFTPPDDYP